MNRDSAAWRRRTIAPPWSILIWAAAGSANPAWAHYQRARAYAMLADKKNTLAELKLSLAGGFHEASALDAAEFQAFQGQPEFQTLAAEWKLAAEKERAKP